MRRLAFSVASSLDGFIARKDHSIDWLMWSDEAAEATRGLWSRFDAFVMGRRTFEAAMKTRGAAPAAKEIATYVVSTSLPDDPEGRFEVIRRDVGDFVRRLKTQPGKDICLLGGGALARSLIEAGELDELAVNLHPVLLGDGAPLFPPSSCETRLRLRESRAFRNGCVYSVYDRAA